MHMVCINPMETSKFCLSNEVRKGRYGSFTGLAVKRLHSIKDCLKNPNNDSHRFCDPFVKFPGLIPCDAIRIRPSNIKQLQVLSILPRACSQATIIKKSYTNIQATVVKMNTLKDLSREFFYVIRSIRNYLPYFRYLFITLKNSI